MSRYQLEKLRVGGPHNGFVIHAPDDHTMYDTNPQSIVRELNRLLDRIKRLEEAGDVCLDMSFRGMHVMAERNWRKAKEAKP